MAVSLVLVILSQLVHAEELESFRLLEKKVQDVVETALAATVAITSRQPGGTGSGVIISAEGLILTAAHVTEATGKELNIIFPDGRTVEGIALGANRSLDAGLVKILEESDEPWPHVEMGGSDLVEMGAWCIALGHPGGFMPERKPPVRIGRIWHRDHYGAIYSDCTLIGGDSGGPLFDIDGKVIGVHSSIGGSLSTNRHVGTDSYRLHWDRMLKGDIWGKLRMDPTDGDLASMGVELDWASKDGALIRAVRSNAPAADAGLVAGDRIIQFAGETIGSSIELIRKLAEMQAGDLVSVSVNRSEETVDLEVTLTSLKALLQPPSSADEFASDFPYVGIELDSANDLEGKGARILTIDEDSPADHGGLAVGDVIVSLNDQQVTSDKELIRLVQQLAPGDTMSLLVRRDEEEMSYTIELGRQ